MIQGWGRGSPCPHSIEVPGQGLLRTLVGRGPGQFAPSARPGLYNPAVADLSPTQFTTDAVRVLSLVPLSASARREIEAVNDRVRLTMAPGWFDGEMRATWGDYLADSYLAGGAAGSGTRAERNGLLAEADVVLAGFPVPVDLRARAARLRWVHQTPAGASNLYRCDLWGNDIPVSTSRGLGNTVAMAEYVVATFLYFARALHRAHLDWAAGVFDRSAYRPVQLAGKTVCVIGVGGIGLEVGRQCAALGMHVVGTRSTPGGARPDGFATVGGPDDLPVLLAQATFVAVCCPWTTQTHHLIGAEMLSAMAEDSVLVNVARGEIIDEVALVGALGRLRGVALDVYDGEFDHGPPAGLWAHPKVLITPHISAGSELRPGRPLELFVRNLRALLEERPLENLVDWSRGY